jgi:hypothetical protein
MKLPQKSKNQGPMDCFLPGDLWHFGGSALQ